MGSAWGDIGGPAPASVSHGLYQPPPEPGWPEFTYRAEWTDKERVAAALAYMLARYAWPAGPIGWAAARYRTYLEAAGRWTFDAAHLTALVELLGQVVPAAAGARERAAGQDEELVYGSVEVAAVSLASWAQSAAAYLGHGPSPDIDGPHPAGLRCPAGRE